MTFKFLLSMTQTNFKLRLLHHNALIYTLKCYDQQGQRLFANKQNYHDHIFLDQVVL